jgi:HhH-GPD superfamily base excision DNA repair protein
VIGYFGRVLERYPTIESLALSDYDTFFPYYQGLGYYSRARNILKTAKIIHEQYHGIFPREKDLLSKLPGVWPYTAHALLAFGYGEAYLAWDTNLEKVFARYYHGRKDEKLSKEEKKMIEEDFRSFIHMMTRDIGETEGWKLFEEEKVQKKWWAKASGFFHPSGPFGTFQSWKVRSEYLSHAINNALMDFAALIDLKSANLIDWDIYPIQSGRFYETRGTLEPVEMRKSMTFPLPDAQILLVLHRDHQIYYSKKGGYRPFLLPPALTRDVRKYIQDTFRSDYSLELSVRPPKEKWISKDGVPYILVTAQIQLGDASQFEAYEKKEVRSILDLLWAHTLPLWLEW